MAGVRCSGQGTGSHDKAKEWSHGKLVTGHQQPLLPVPVHLTLQHFQDG